MKRLFRRLQAHRDAAVLIACLLAALVAAQINDDRADSRPQIAEVTP